MALKTIRYEIKNQLFLFGKIKLRSILCRILSKKLFLGGGEFAMRMVLSEAKNLTWEELSINEFPVRVFF